MANKINVKSKVEKNAQKNLSLQQKSL